MSFKPGKKRGTSTDYFASESTEIRRKRMVSLVFPIPLILHMRYLYSYQPIIFIFVQKNEK